MSKETPRSYWLNEAFSAEGKSEARRLEKSLRTDVCIVGGGFTGLWTALHLKRLEPSLEVTLIERDLCGSGASGRNGGFLVSWWAKFLTLKKICGEEEGLRLAQASDQAISDILKFCESEHIDVQARRDGWLWAATSDAQIGAWGETMDALARAGQEPFVAWSPEEVALRSGSVIHRAGVFDPSPASLQPAILARGMRRAAIAIGVNIYERTPMEDIRFGVPAMIETAAGRIVADRVVIAMNAWGARFAKIRQSIAVVSGDIVMTPPIGEQLESIGWTDGLGISDGRALVHYYRTTPDGRVVFGKGGMCGEFCYGGKIGNQVEGRSTIEDTVARSFRWTYPRLADVEVATSWRGPIDRSQSGLPIFWHLGPNGNVHYAVGFSGNGVGPCYLAGRILASLALERSDEWASTPLVRPPTRDFPPEPFRYFGSKLLRSALIKADQAEDVGKPVPWVARFMARFAPAGVSPFEVDKSTD